MQFIVPARNGQLKEIINELKNISDCIGLRVTFILLFHNIIIIGFFLFYNVDNEFLKITIESSDVYFTQLLLCLIYFFIFDNISVD